VGRDITDQTDEMIFDFAAPAQDCQVSVKAGVAESIREIGGDAIASAAAEFVKY
jgi:hypothetical protein